MWQRAWSQINLIPHSAFLPSLFLLPFSFSITPCTSWFHLQFFLQFQSCVLSSNKSSPQTFRCLGTSAVPKCFSQAGQWCKMMQNAGTCSSAMFGRWWTPQSWHYFLPSKHNNQPEGEMKHNFGLFIKILPLAFFGGRGGWISSGKNVFH